MRVIETGRSSAVMWFKGCQRIFLMCFSWFAPNSDQLPKMNWRKMQSSIIWRSWSDTGINGDSQNIEIDEDVEEDFLDEKELLNN